MDTSIVLPVKQIWIDVKGFEGLYQVSNYGKVRSLTRTVNFIRKGKVCSVEKQGKILSPKIDDDGYHNVTLSKEGKRHYLRVHRLVGEAFVKGYSPELVIDHKDNVKDNNMYYNLRWVTNTVNSISYYANHYKSNYRPPSALTKEEWLYVKFLNWNNIQYQAICENLGIDVGCSYHCLGQVLSGRRLSSVTGFTEEDIKPDNSVCIKCKEDDVVEMIRERLIEGVSLKDLSSKYGLAESIISRICNGKRRKPAYLKYLEKYGKC